MLAIGREMRHWCGVHRILSAFGSNVKCQKRETNKGNATSALPLDPRRRDRDHGKAATLSLTGRSRSWRMVWRSTAVAAGLPCSVVAYEALPRARRADAAGLAPCAPTPAYCRGCAGGMEEHWIRIQPDGTVSYRRSRGCRGLNGAALLTACARRWRGAGARRRPALPHPHLGLLPRPATAWDIALHYKIAGQFCRRCKRSRRCQGARERGCHRRSEPPSWPIRALNRAAPRPSEPGRATATRRLRPARRCHGDRRQPRHRGVGHVRLLLIKCKISTRT